MRILILEDNVNRFQSFEQNLFCDHMDEVEWVKTPLDAIEKLKGETYDYLFLDHDLYGKVYVPSGPDTGYEVASWLFINADKMPRTVILHTLNSDGAHNMQQKLQDSLYCPGIWYMSWGQFLIAVEQDKTKEGEK